MYSWHLKLEPVFTLHLAVNSAVILNRKLNFRVQSVIVNIV